MDLGLSDRAALVTGSTRGIGRAIAEVLAREGAKVCVCGRGAESVETTKAELRCAGFAADLTQENAAADLVECASAAIGPIDVIVANVGSGRGPLTPVAGRSAWRDAFETNLWSAIEIVEAALPGMLVRGHGSIVLVGSIAGLEDHGAPLPYGSAKAAVASYAAGLARRVGGEGVRVNCVAPGNVMFPGGRWEELRESDTDGVDQMIEREVPMNRFASPEEIASVAAFLASDRASFVTGQTLAVDGGQTRSLR
ncbi:MAG: SDR family NAD(P)-dependent oxidoreductase [Planctomycetota bacterium]